MLKTAPPPLHAKITICLFLITIFIYLPSLSSLDEVATSETFVNSIYDISPVVLGYIRLFFAAFIATVTIWTILFESWSEAMVYLPGSKLKSTMIPFHGMRTQVFVSMIVFDMLITMTSFLQIFNNLTLYSFLIQFIDKFSLPNGRGIYWVYPSFFQV